MKKANNKAKRTQQARMRKAKNRAQKINQQIRKIDWRIPHQMESTDFNAINKNTGHPNLHDVLEHIYDKDTEQAESIVLGTVLTVYHNLEYFRQSADKNKNTHCRECQFADGVPMSDYFVDIRGVSDEALIHCIAQYREDFMKGKRVLRPGIDMDNNLQIQTVISYATPYKDDCVLMQIRGLRTPNGTVKTTVNFNRMPRAVYASWASVSDSNEMSFAVGVA
jgi:hypothetical protein